MSDGLFAGSAAAAFMAGMVAFFAPCCAGVMLPAYLGAVAGGSRWRIARLTALYVAGVAAVVWPITLGASALAALVTRWHGPACPQNPGHGALLDWPTERAGWYCPHRQHDGPPFYTTDLVPVPRSGSEPIPPLGSGPGQATGAAIPEDSGRRRRPIGGLANESPAGEFGDHPPGIITECEERNRWPVSQSPSTNRPARS